MTTKLERKDNYGHRLCDIIRVNGKLCNRRASLLLIGNQAVCPIHADGELT